MEEFYKIVAYVLGGVLGVCVGSFLNVVIYRLPRGMRLDKPGSHCTVCDYYLRWYDNVPVLSYLLLGGKCRKCRAPISPRYTVVEIVNMLLWLLSVHLFWDQSIAFAVIAALTSSILVCTFFIDLEHMIVPDSFVVILGALGVAATFLDPSYGWVSHLIGAAVGFGIFYGVFAFFYYLLKKDGLGGGDIKLALVMGLLLGWERLLLSMIIASVSAAVILSVLSAMRREGRDKEYPFAPFLCVGFAVAMFFGTVIINAYLGLLGYNPI